jgi:uncharacterized RDD family membrane protein YckC
LRRKYKRSGSFAALSKAEDALGKAHVVQDPWRTGLTRDGALLTANLAQRLVARFVDAVVVFVLALVVAIATNSSDDAFIGFIFAMVPVYEIPLVAFFGCTVGKLWPSRIRVVAVKNGRPPGLLRATVRTLLVWPAVLLGRLRWLMPARFLAWLDGLHDRAAGTVVLTTAAVRALHDRPQAERRRLLVDARRRQLGGLEDEERELDSALG